MASKNPRQDLTLAHRLAAQYQLKLNVSTTASAQLQAQIDAGHANADLSCIILPPTQRSSTT